MMSNRIFRMKLRRPSGAALAEGTAFLYVFALVAFAIMSLLALVISYGVHVYYKSKIGLAAHSAAHYAAQTTEFLGFVNTVHANVETEASGAAGIALNQMGLPAAKFPRTVTATKVTVNGHRYVEVVITVKKIPVFPIALRFFPNMAKITETA